MDEKKRDLRLLERKVLIVSGVLVFAVASIIASLAYWITEKFLGSWTSVAIAVAVGIAVGAALIYALEVDFY